VQAETTENTPLNNIQYLSPNNQQAIMDADTKRVAIKIVIDVVLLASGML
jgi:hypothetical protein